MSPVANVLPSQDIAITQSWEADPFRVLGQVYLRVANGTSIGGHTPDDTTFIYSDSGSGPVDEFMFGYAPVDATTITQIAVNIRAKIEDAGGLATIDLTLYDVHDAIIGAMQSVTQGDLGGASHLGECTKTWSGLSIPKLSADGMYIKTVFNLNL